MARARGRSVLCDAIILRSQHVTASGREVPNALRGGRCGERRLMQSPRRRQRLQHAVTRPARQRRQQRRDHAADGGGFLIRGRGLQRGWCIQGRGRIVVI